MTSFKNALTVGVLFASSGGLLTRVMSAQEAPAPQTTATAQVSHPEQQTSHAEDTSPNAHAEATAKSSPGTTGDASPNAAASVSASIASTQTQAPAATPTPKRVHRKAAAKNPDAPKNPDAKPASVIYLQPKIYLPEGLVKTTNEFHLDSRAEAKTPVAQAQAVVPSTDADEEPEWAVPEFKPGTNPCTGVKSEAHTGLVVSGGRGIPAASINQGYSHKVVWKRGADGVLRKDSVEDENTGSANCQVTVVPVNSKFSGIATPTRDLLLGASALTWALKWKPDSTNVTAEGGTGGTSSSNSSATGGAATANSSSQAKSDASSSAVNTTTVKDTNINNNNNNNTNDNTNNNNNTNNNKNNNTLNNTNNIDNSGDKGKHKKKGCHTCGTSEVIMPHREILGFVAVVGKNPMLLRYDLV